jgi:hypothetical protein
MTAMTQTSEPVVVVSNDTHIGPRLVEDLRLYCPATYLDEFDRFAASTAAEREAATTMLEGSGYLDHPNFRTAGHHDSAARLADYDHDGVAAGVLFHGSMNLEPIPFVASPLGKPKKEAAMRDGELPEYNRRVWEPFWSACAELRMPLVTHVGGGTNARYTGLEAVALMQLESAGFLSQRAVWWMIFAGVLRRNVFFGASFASPFEVHEAIEHGVVSQLLWGSIRTSKERSCTATDRSSLRSRGSRCATRSVAFRSPTPAA